MMEFVNGKDDISYMKWKITFMFETTNQLRISWVFNDQQRQINHEELGLHGI